MKNQKKPTAAPSRHAIPLSLLTCMSPAEARRAQIIARDAAIAVLG